MLCSSAHGILEHQLTFTRLPLVYFARFAINPRLENFLSTKDFKPLCPLLSLIGSSVERQAKVLVLHACCYCLKNSGRWIQTLTFWLLTLQSVPKRCIYLNCVKLKLWNMAHTYVELFSKAIIIVKLNLIKNIYDVYLLLVFLQVFIINTPNFEDFLIESGKYLISFGKIFSSFVSKALSYSKTKYL